MKANRLASMLPREFWTVCALAFALTTDTVRAATNSWIDGNGKWETATNWSLGSAPSTNDTSDLITNAGNNTVTIDTTTTNSPATLTISNLTISANTLSLLNAGTNVPLHILNLLTLTNGATMVVTNSAFRTDGVSVGAASSTEISDSSLKVQAGSSVLFNGLGADVAIYPSDRATLTVEGGTVNLPGTLSIGDRGTGTLWVANGTLHSDNLIVGLAGLGSATVSNGSVIVDYQFMLGNNAGSQGSLTILGGSVSDYTFMQIGNIFGAQPCTVVVRGGALYITNATGTAQLNLNNGTLILSNDATIVADTYTNLSATFTNLGGTFTLKGPATVDQGTATFAGTNQFGATFVVASTAGSTGTVNVTGGQFVVTNDVISIGNDGTITSGGGVGKVTVSNGTLVASTILLGSSAGGRGDLILGTGGTISCPFGSNCLIAINSLGFDPIGGTLAWDGGTLEIGITAAGDYNVSGSQTVCDDLYAGYGNAGTMTIAGGVVNVTSRLIIGHLGSPVSTGAVWMTGGQLTIPNNYTIIGNSGVGQLTMSNGTMTATSVLVGNGSNPGSLTVAGGTLTALTGVTVGDCGSVITGIVTITGGNVFVTNAAHNAMLDVRSGTLTISGGFVKVDKLVMTNGCGRLFRTGGTLQYSQIVLDPSLSAVGDSIPNSWKLQYGLDPFDPNLANEDADGDGVSNLREYQLGTDPTIPSSPYHIRAIAKEGNDIRVTWTTVGGMTNIVQVTPGTANGSYTNNFSDLSPQLTIVGSTVTTTNYLDLNGATNSPSRYYRIRLVP